ncbi:thiosulfate ABC transporter substrate-binding protein CysP [Halotalea alkalilenta]|uniref:thiosulfate ABC transporter substrate-binding protein CysP n=1 Tax=Halotalea alkalilenta TaxID=376489 RepID=UPI0006945B21|nr:thiosulfate ABC transporter substrate-binding protein CysP [Halotalea alkalilenta]
MNILSKLSTLRLGAGLLGAATLGLSLTAPLSASAAERTLMNASYDVSRELFTALNPPFIEQWREAHGEEVEIQQSHAGSSTQARSIIEGLRADVVTFNQTTDIDVLANAGLVAEDWQSRLADNSSPFYSTMAFLVRKGNPKGIEDWQDLAEDGVRVVFPNPKTSGNARYTYLAAWAAAARENGGDEVQTEAYMRKLLANVAVFDTGGRGATTSFVERGIGDVLISFESEVQSISREYGDDSYEVVVPPVDLLAEFPVAWVDDSVRRNQTEDLARAYLEYLYSPAAQRIIAEHNYRVRDPEVAREFSDRFPETELLDVNQEFGDWDTITRTHFASGAKLDQLLRR